uniref:Anoctamin n=1 Tax=Romanomermis culicivorax TaxID=13658 RepID=A0A915JJS9_ROMCU
MNPELREVNPHNVDKNIDSRSLWIKKFNEFFDRFKEKLFGLEEYDYSPANRDEETSNGLTNQSARRKWRQKSFVINWPFKQKHVKRFAIRNRDTFFTEQQRLEIVYEILERAPIDPDRPKRRGLSALLENGTYECAYPLHDGDVNIYGHETKPTCNRQWLKLFWASWKRCFQVQPLLQVRNYFGEKIGFYYVFMDCYTSMLIYPSLAGIVALIIGLAQYWNSDEVKALCEQHEPSPNHISNFWMCPICEPPACEAWLMKHEGCFQYTWSYVIDNSWSLFLSVFIMLWAIVFLKVWRRREARVAVEWCTEDVAEQDFTIRPNYEERALHVIQNPVTGELEPHIPLTRRCLWIGVSLSATLLMVIFACLCLMILVLSRIALYGALKKLTGFVANRNVECSRWLVHGLIFIVVLLLEKAYHVLAHKLTIFECPKTQSKFMTSLLWKIFVFQLLNDFVPIAYAAWMKGKTVNSPLDMKFLDELCDGGCLGEVTELIAVLLLARLIFGNISEVGIPFLKNAVKNFLHRNVMDDKNHTKSVPQFLKDFHLNEVELDGVYDEYMEMMIQFAFIVLFIPALPASAFVCFLNNIAEIRVDAINMLLSYRRPLPIRAPGIGIWNQFLDVIIKSGVICNAALLAFTSDIIPRLYYVYMINPNRTVTGFTRFSLNRLPIDGYIRNNEHHVDFHASLKKQNVSDCWYPDYSYSSRFEERGKYRKCALAMIHWELNCTSENEL